MITQELPHPKSIPCNLWTIRRPSLEFWRGKYDIALGLSDANICYPLHVTHLWDKSDPDEDAKIKDTVCDKLMWTDDGIYIVACNLHIFGTKDAALNAFKEKVKHKKEFLEMLQQDCKELLELIDG